MGRCRAVLVLALVAFATACGRGDENEGAPASSATSTSTTSTTAVFEARFDDVDDFGDWLASHGIDCPIRADDGGHVCELEAVEGADVTAEAVRVAIADTEVELDEWRSEKGFYVYGYTWGLHFENQDNANAVFTRLPDASFEEVLAPPS